jgi:hypothetical protein
VALSELRKTVVPQIREYLAPPPAIAPPSAPPSAPEARSQWGATTLIPLALVVVAAFALALLILRRRAQQGPVKEDVLASTERPENLMTESDLASTPVREPDPEPVVLLEMNSADGHGPDERRRIKIELGERIVIGKTPIAADLAFSKLRQAQTVELRFDKEGEAPTLRAYRLRPDVRGVLDAVKANDKQAPPIFILRHGDRLTIGDINFRVVFTDQKFLPLLTDVSVAEGGRSDRLADPLPTTPALSPPVPPSEEPLLAPKEHFSLRRRINSPRHSS